MYEQYENLSSGEARKLVDERLAAWGITYAAHYAGERVKRDWGTDGEGQKVDAFRVSFSGWETEFFMGLGNRKARIDPYTRKPVKRPRFANPLSPDVESWDKLNLKPVSPSAADVLYCLLSDAEAANMSFGDWCDSFGYDSDSIKALTTYQTCDRTGRELARIINHARMAELRAILQNF